MRGADPLRRSELRPRVPASSGTNETPEVIGPEHTWDVTTGGCSNVHRVGFTRKRSRAAPESSRRSSQVRRRVESLNRTALRKTYGSIFKRQHREVRTHTVRDCSACTAHRPDRPRKAGFASTVRMLLEGERPNRALVPIGHDDAVVLGGVSEGRIRPLSSSRCSAGYNAPCSTCSTSSEPFSKAFV